MANNEANPAFGSFPRLRRIVAICLLCLPATTWAAHEHGSSANILISDQFNNRVIEVDAKTHAVVWQFGDGSGVAGPTSVVGVNDAERFGPFTLISGTGTPASTPPLPGCPNTSGCPDNRVFVVDRGGNILWQYGQAGVAGSAADQLNTPVQSVFLPGFPGQHGLFVMITDQGNQRVILVDLNKDIVWQYGMTGTSGNGANQLNNPNSAELLENGDVLIADESNNRVIEVKPADNSIVATFTAGGTVSGAAFASRLKNGDTLISDSNNNRIVEVDANDTVVWQYVTNTQSGSNPNPLPTRGIRLRNGDTLISDQFNNRVIEVTKAGNIVFQQGMLNVAGNGANQLNGPYDAKRIGDFTGLTPPLDFDDDGDD